MYRSCVTEDWPAGIPPAQPVAMTMVFRDVHPREVCVHLAWTQTRRVPAAFSNHHFRSFVYWVYCAPGG